MADVIFGINDSVISVLNAKSFQMRERVFVGPKKLMGEVIRVETDQTKIQVYESTTGLRPGDPVEGSGQLLTATLGPGLLRSIYDGIQRPLEEMVTQQGAFIQEGAILPALDQEKLWPVTLKVAEGDYLSPGQLYATTPETPLIEHRCLVPPGISGKVVQVAPSGSYRVSDPLVTLQLDNQQRKTLTLCQEWPIRIPRPVAQRLPISVPLITGQRVLDTLFPIAKGGAAAIPGGFGAGKTMLQHQIAKWCDADIIIYVGCGERGNEMTQVLEEFRDLQDPKSGHSLLDRTCLIANTSNMPVAAREASVYTGVTLAEYYRDMGYHVALMADSTSRWAEALREISGRLEEMPAEEGFPAYLPSRIAQFYERAGYVQTLGGQTGSVTLIGAVSPQGGDFSEPVTQNTKRFVRCFWALDKSLAYARHYPAINWTDSYSEYTDDLSRWFSQTIGHDFFTLRNELQSLLHEENQLMEVVKLIGADVLPEEQKLTLQLARVIRMGFLQQNSFNAEDTAVSLEKQYKMMKVIHALLEASRLKVAQQIPVSSLMSTGIFEHVAQMKYDIPNRQIDLLDDYPQQIEDALSPVK